MSIEERVKRGVKLLDEERPGWRQEIDIEELRMSSFAQCILGQLFGSFNDGVTSILDDDEEPAFFYGFDVEEDSRCQDSEYRELREAWVGEIQNGKPQARTYTDTVISDANKEEQRLSEEIDLLKERLKSLKSQRKEVRTLIDRLS